MRLAFRLCRAPRARRAGAFCVVPWAVVLGLAGFGSPRAASAQVPDTIQVGDTLQLADSLFARPDSLGPAVPDSIRQVLDSLAALGDSLAGLVDTFPEFSTGVAPSWEVGVWRWDRSALGSNRALTLSELVSQVPGVLPLRGGDYGTPLAAIAFGAAGGRVRVFLDGFEWVPLDGGVADLSRIGLGGLDDVRVERHPGELRIELRSREPTDLDPQTLVDVGTGDLGTSILRGILAHPNTLGGAFTFALDRLETRGPALEAAGSLSGLGLRYAIARNHRGGLSAEWRRFATKTDVEAFPASVTRSDWNLRGRWRFTDALTGEGYWGASSLRGGADDPLYGDVDTRRSQFGVRARWEKGGVWATSSSRFLRGGGLPSATQELAAGASLPRVGSVDGSLRLERWSGEGASSRRVRAVTGRVVGLSLFASYEDGRSGVPFVPEFDEYLRSLEPPPDTLPPDEPEPETEPPDTVPPAEPLARFTQRTGVRAGATLAWRTLSLSGARLSVEADSLRPLGVLLDRDTAALAGGRRTGYEVAASLPLPISGFRIEAAFQSWDEELPYLPKRTWNGAVTYHRVFKESGNLEVWGTIGVTGRDAMLLRAVDPDPPPNDVIGEPGGGDPDADPRGPPLLGVPFYREWFTHIQVRIVSVNIFVRSENITGKEDNFDFPDREQPRFRTMYGVRWIMNN